MSEAPFADWIGREETSEDVAAPLAARALAATLDRDPAPFAPGAEVPAIWSWAWFLPVVPMSGLGPDGHPARGGFLPSVDLARRMWAGSRVRLHDTIRLGEAISRRSRIAAIAAKDGKAGRMVFVTVTHEVSTPRGPAMSEEQDIVYLAIPEQFAPPPATFAPRPPDWSVAWPVDPVALFRFSAVTFNGHRIHYDRTYAREVEKYPGLVVHGPFQAMALFEAARARAAGRVPARFDFRGVRPLFDHDAASLNGRAEEDGSLALYTANAEGVISMSATLGFA